MVNATQNEVTPDYRLEEIFLDLRRENGSIGFEDFLIWFGHQMSVPARSRAWFRTPN